MDNLPEDKLSVGLTETPLVKGVPLTYAMLCAIAGMLAFFGGQSFEANYFQTVFIAVIVALFLYLIGKEITRADDCQLAILGHYLITRGVLNAWYFITNPSARKGEWCDL